jgi:protein O-GlcNAc transferase
MAPIEEAFEAAFKHHQAGRWAEAEQAYRQILNAAPQFAGAWYCLGLLASQRGDADTSANCLLTTVGLAPHFVDAHVNLGAIFLNQGDIQRALFHSHRATEIQPDSVAANFNLAGALRAAGRIDEAIRIYQRVIELSPSHQDAHTNLGNLLKESGRLDESIACFQRLLELYPDFAEGWSNLGTALQAQGQPAAAIHCYQTALGLKPNQAPIYNNWGTAALLQGKTSEAVTCFQRAIALDPHFADPHNNLGMLHEELGQIDDAIACFERSLKLSPNHVEAHNNLANALQTQGKLDEAVACYRRALELRPHDANARSNLLVTLQYRPSVSLAELAAAHAEYDQFCAAPLRATWRPHENDRTPDRPLRVGFVSPNFGSHPVGYFLIRALENIDHRQCQTICYSDQNLNDQMTSRLQAAAWGWRDVNSLPDEQLAEQIRADRIDILFDLAGHTAKHRLLMFARKPAPIQVTWLDYVGTTGLAAIDYILADSYEIPTGAEAYYRERVLRMPDGYICYEAPPYAPPVSPLPALQHGSVTFGSFNNRAKITSLSIAVWSKILHRLPQSRMVLKYTRMSFPSIAKGLAGQFASYGIDPARIEFHDWSPHAELLAEYNRIDLALDTIPYNGGLTTCEALWMGVPVITCPGETFASRHSLSHSTNAGLTETIARNLDEYVEIAVSLASDLPRLAALRASLRSQMAASPLCDGNRFAHNLTRILRDIWSKSC